MSDEQFGDGIYNIPEANFKKFEEAIAKLSRKAEKLMGESISPIIFGYHMEDQPDGTQIKVYEVLLGGPKAKLAGWEFLASIDHSNKELGNLVRVLPGKTVAAHYRHVGSDCDHCKVNRFRRDTFVVENTDTHEVKQVGRSCLKDFLGHENPEKIAKLAELLGYADEVARGYRNSQGGDRRYIDLETYLAHVAKLVRERGYYVTRKMAQEKDMDSTAGSALSLMNYTRKVVEEYPTEDDYQLANAAIDWAQNLGEDGKILNDYEHNIHVIAASGAIEFRSTGFAASIVNAYYREHGLYEKRNKIDSQFVGVIGERLEADVEVNLVKAIEGAYGWTYLHKMVTPDGNLFTTFASKKLADEGQKVHIKATVKNHEEYKGMKQTIVTRVKVV